MSLGGVCIYKILKIFKLCRASVIKNLLHKCYISNSFASKFQNLIKRYKKTYLQFR